VETCTDLHAASLPEGTKQEENSGFAEKNANALKKKASLSPSFVLFGKKRAPQIFQLVWQRNGGKGMSRATAPRTNRGSGA
jgi:hypothetical protein